MFNEKDWEDNDGDVRGGKVAAYIFLAVIALILLLGSFGVVSAGERGVKTRLGAVKGIVQPGFYLKLPLVDGITKMDVRTQSMTATKEAPLSAASNDLQDTRLAVVVNYHIEPSTVADIYQQYGTADTYYTSVVDPLIIATVKAVASQYTAADQIQKRAEMSSKALEALQAAFEGKNVQIEKADITDVAFSESFTQAIEAKVTAVQDAEAAKNKLAQVQYEAQQTVATAQAQAEAIKIQAQAINSQGGADYVQLQAIKAWNGVLPTQMIPGATVPFLNLKN
jgi:regulator of protease activity HflC (stomatin/prohibitin superfamily)